MQKLCRRAPQRNRGDVSFSAGRRYGVRRTESVQRVGGSPEWLAGKRRRGRQAFCLSKDPFGVFSGNRRLTLTLLLA